MYDTNFMDIIDTIGTAAHQSDRWLFIAAITILGLFAWSVVRWLVNKTQTQSETLHELIREVSKDSKEIAVLLATKAKVIEANSTCISQNTEMLREVREVVGRCAIFQQHMEDGVGNSTKVKR